MAEKGTPDEMGRKSSFQVPVSIYRNLGIPGKATLLFGQHAFAQRATSGISESWPHSTPSDPSALVHPALLYRGRKEPGLENVNH